MEAYQLQLFDNAGRPIIDKPIDVDELLRQQNRTMHVGPAVTVHLDEVPSGGEESAGESEAARVAARRHGFEDGVHAPFGFGEVQEWFDMIQAVEMPSHHGSSHSALFPNHRQPQAADGDGGTLHMSALHKPAGAAGSPAASPQHGNAPSGPTTQPQAAFSQSAPHSSQPTSTTNPRDIAKEKIAAWSAYAPVADRNRNFKIMKWVDVTPDAKTFSPLPLAMHSCAGLIGGGGADGAGDIPHTTATKFYVFGGTTNGKSTESELYEFSLATGSWRRIEARGVSCASRGQSVVVVDGRRVVSFGGASPAANATRIVLPTSVPPSVMPRMQFCCGSHVTSTAAASKRSASPFANIARSASSARVRGPATANDARSRAGVAVGAPLLLGKRAASPSQMNNNTTTRDVLVTQSTGLLSLVQDFDVPTIRWRTAQLKLEGYNMSHLASPIHLYGHTAVTFGPTMILFGGIQETMELNDHVIYVDLATFHVRYVLSGHRTVSNKSSQQQQQQPCSRFFHSAVTYGHWMIIYGGLDGENNVLDDAWAFDLVEYRWERLTLQGESSPRAGHTAVLIGCRLLLIGGFDVSWLTDDSGAAKPLNTVIELNLVPNMQTQFVIKPMPCTPKLPRIAFAAGSSCGDGCSLFLYGGVTVAPKKKAKDASSKTAAADAGEDEEGSDNEEEEEESHDNSTLQRSRGSAADADDDGHEEDRRTAFFRKFRTTNTTLLVTFPVQQQAQQKEKKPRLNHLGIEIDETELDPTTKAFLKRQDDFIKKKNQSVALQMKRAHLEECEGAEVSLYLTPEEIRTMIGACSECCESLVAYDSKGLPSHVPDRAERISIVEECVSLMRQAKDIMNSMNPRAGPKQVMSKGHRKKTGRKFIEDPGAGKPFRRVVVMDLIRETHHHLEHLKTLNKSLKTVDWPEKSEYLEYVTSMRVSLLKVVAEIKAILTKYIEHRIESLVKAGEKHANQIATLRKLSEAARKKVSKQEDPDAAFQAKRRRQQEEEKARQAALDEENQKRAKHGLPIRTGGISSPDSRKKSKSPQGRKSTGASPDGKRGTSPTYRHRPSPATTEDVVIEISKDEAKAVLRRAGWAQKAAMDLSSHCNATMSATVAVVTTTTSEPGAPLPPAAGAQDAVVRDSDKARSSAIALSNTIAASVYAFCLHFPTVLEQMQGKQSGRKQDDNAVTPDPSAVAGGAAAPPADIPKDRNNVCLRRSWVTPLVTQAEEVKTLVQSVGRIRHNSWDKHDMAGPKQDEKAESLARALLNRLTEMVTHLSSAFLMRAGARSARSKSVTVDPHNIALQPKVLRSSSTTKNKDGAARKKNDASPGVATTTASEPFVDMRLTSPSTLSRLNAPMVLTFGQDSSSAASYQSPTLLQNANGLSEPQRGTASVVQPTAVFYATWTAPSSSASAPAPTALPSQSVSVSPQPTAVPTDRLPPQQVSTVQVASLPYGSSTYTPYAAPEMPPPPTAAPPVYAAVEPLLAAPSTSSHSVPSTAPAVARPVTPPPSSATTTSAAPPVAVAPPQPVMAPWSLQPLNAPQPTPAIPAARTATPPPAPTTTTSAPPVGAVPTPAAIMPQPQATIPPPAAVMTPTTSSSTPYAAVPTAAPLSVSQAAPNTTPAVAQVPPPPPPSTSAPAPPIVAATEGQQQAQPAALPPRPVQPVAIGSGAFNGGFGSLGTYAPVADYMVVQRPQSSYYAPPPSSSSPATAAAASGPRVLPSTATRTPTEERMFKGKLTPGERAILKNRELNRH